MDTPITRGSCGCGAVAWEITAPLVEVHHCHCGRCFVASKAPWHDIADALPRFPGYPPAE